LEASSNLLVCNVCPKTEASRRNRKSLLCFFYMEIADQIEVSQPAPQLDWLVWIILPFPVSLPG